MMLISYFVIDFVLDIPEKFPSATPWSALGWITGTGLVVVGGIISLLTTMVLNQAKRNFAQGKKIMEKQNQIIDEIHENTRRDLDLRKDHNDLVDRVDDHEERISKLEKSK